MGATFSYLGYASHRQSCPRSREHVTQQFNQYCGPLCVLSSGEVASLSFADLCTRLGATQKDLEISRAENAKREAVICYFLQSSHRSSNVGIKEAIVQLKEQHLALKATIDGINKENEEIKSKLGKAEEAISSLSSTSFDSNCPTLGEVVSEDPINLFGYSEQLDDTKLNEEERILPDDLDVSENEDLGTTSPNRSLHQSLDLDSKKPPYIFRFTESNEGGKPSDDVNFHTKSLREPQRTSGSLTSIPKLGQNTVDSAESDASSSLLSAIEPRWSISKTFTSNQECKNVAHIDKKKGGFNDLNNSHFSRYGIRYMPPDGQLDVYRTIIVSNLTPDIRLGTLLDHVRGGLVVDARLLDTVKITGKKSALITFHHEYAAIAFEEYAETHPVKINSIVAKVHLVCTPTWPLQNRLREAIDDYRHTRCLMVSNFPERIPAPQFRTDLSIHVGTDIDPITYMQEGNNGFVELHFSSIEWAGRACDMLATWKFYRACKPFSSWDPCTRPLFDTCGRPTDSGLYVGKERAEPAVADQSGRLANVEWAISAEQCRGRGFGS